MMPNEATRKNGDKKYCDNCRRICLLDILSCSLSTEYSYDNTKHQYPNETGIRPGREYTNHIQSTGTSSHFVVNCFIDSIQLIKQRSET